MNLSAISHRSNTAFTYAADNDNVIVTLKTGKDIDDSWYVCLGPTDDCNVVVAMVLEQGGEGTATFAALPVIEAALQYQGDL